MKTHFKKMALALPFIGLGMAGCGGYQDEYTNALPSAEALSMQVDGLESASAQSVSGEVTAEALPLNDTCHPHLFQRTHEVVRILNGIIQPLMKRVDDAIEDGPHEKTGKTHTWLRTHGKEDIRVSVTRTSDTTYSFEVDVKAKGAADSTYTAVLSGTLTPDTASKKAHDGSGTMHLDLSALAKADPDEKATGLLDVSYRLADGTQTMDVTVKAYEPNDASIVRPPRDAHYVYMRTAGMGGSVKFEENVVLYCPSNPDKKVADVRTVSRWMQRADKSVVGRSDAMATGGQITQADRWMGVTCATRDAKETAGAERYWQMKLEDAKGNTVRGDSSYSAADSANPTSTCDAALGAMPSLDTPSGDYDFSKVNFADSTPVPIPKP